jgi:hypothetical protein
MRRYDILSGVLLIISITNFAIAAPVSLQEKHQARVDVVHVPKNATTVLGKRMDAWLEKVVAQYFEAAIKAAEPSDAHVSSSLAPLRTKHGSTNVVQASADPDDDFDWAHWNDAVNRYINHPPPKEVGQVTGQSTGTGAYSHWNNPWLARLPETSQPTRLTPTKLDEHPDFMAANQPPLYQPPRTEFEYDEVNWPSLPKKGKEKKLSDILSDLPSHSQEEFDSHLYPGSVAPSRLAGARLATVPKYELAPPPPPTGFEYNEVNWPSLTKNGKKKKLSDISSDLPSQEEFDSYLYPGPVEPPRWAGAKWPTVPKHELTPPPSPDSFRVSEGAPQE